MTCRCQPALASAGNPLIPTVRAHVLPPAPAVNGLDAPHGDDEFRGQALAQPVAGSANPDQPTFTAIQPQPPRIHATSLEVSFRGN